MKWDLTVSLAIPAIIGVVGWYVVNLLAARRDRANKRREIRTQYLLHAYRSIAAASYRIVDEEVAKGVESAIQDIQLFGNTIMIDLARTYQEELVQTRKTNPSPLLRTLRGEIRRELGLPQVQQELFWIRIDPEKGRQK